MHDSPPQTWLARSTYLRLIVPILLLIVAVTVVRYHALIQSERNEVQARTQAKLAMTGHAVLQHLPLEGANTARTQELLLYAAQQQPTAIQSLQWQIQGQADSAIHLPAPVSKTPEWFAEFISPEAPRQRYTQRMADGRTGTLTVTLWPGPQADYAWDALMLQARISLLNIVTILVLLALVLRANGRMLGRLLSATNEFKQGQLGTRMNVTGSPESRVVARTFNDMAGKVQSLVLSLQETQRLQSEQLHFTHQLIDALPLPIYVRSTDGIFMETNRAWRELLHTPPTATAGVTLEQAWAADHDTASALPLRLVDLPSGSEVTVRPCLGPERRMAYYHAPFTATDGSPLGTIGALVDMTNHVQPEHAESA